MTQEELLKRIKNVDYITINNMSYEVIAQLTQKFDELMVKELLKRGKTNEQQRAILKTIKRSYKEWNKNETWGWVDIPGAFKYPKFLNELQVDIECGLMITDEKDADNLEERMDDYMAKHTMTKEDIDKAISDYKNKKVTVEKYSETTAALEARKKELEAEIEELKSENKELKKQQPTEQPAEDDIESMKQQISELKMEIADMEKREGLDAPKAALLVRIACTKLGGMPNNRENAWPLISNLWGTAEAAARKRLRERVKEETVEDLASLFESVSPKIAGIIREEGKVIIEKQKKVK